ncbi:MAG: hypothetical protein GC152_04320 [Alphaproteobacteria bacterium]|nr:hypothetical protein [Alphaproteobacteria bacterium]
MRICKSGLVSSILLAGCATVAPQIDEAALAKPAVETVYEGFAAGDIALATSRMSPEIVWLEAEGNPYSDLNPYQGPEAIVNGLFVRLATEWDAFTATPSEYVVEDDRVIVFGRYTGTYKATGSEMDVPFVHAYTVPGGQITAFQQYTDTETHTAAMVGDEDVSAVLQARTDTILRAIETNDTNEVLKLFTSNAVYSPDGDTLFTTPNELAAYWEAVVNSPAADGVLEVVDIQWLAPDAFVELQRYEVLDADGALMFGGYASLLWRKVDGVWHIARDVSN